VKYFFQFVLLFFTEGFGVAYESCLGKSLVRITNKTTGGAIIISPPALQFLFLKQEDESSDREADREKSLVL